MAAVSQINSAPNSNAPMIHSWTGLSSVKHRSIISTGLLASNVVWSNQPAVVHGRWPLSHRSAALLTATRLWFIPEPAFPVKRRSIIPTGLLASNAVRAIQPAVVHGRWPLSHRSAALLTATRLCFIPEPAFPLWSAGLSSQPAC